MAGPLRGQGERGSSHPSKAPPRHLGPGHRWPTALQHLPPDDGTNAPTAPTATHPGFNPTPELTATQQWWVTFMGDRVFARARAVGKNPTEAGQARAKAEAGIALSIPACSRI